MRFCKHYKAYRMSYLLWVVAPIFAGAAVAARAVRLGVLALELVAGVLERPDAEAHGGVAVGATLREELRSVRVGVAVLAVLRGPDEPALAVT